ncbi:MAG: SDR family NAD(P)-dependent oxidoreductase [Pseudomonadota bacterium]
MNIMIIGGTSGIGLALARHYLERGERVAVCGRHVNKVDPSLVARHPALRQYAFDIADTAAMDAAMRDFGAELDMLIVTAGFYADADTLARAPQHAATLLRTNVTALANAFDLASRGMVARRAGQLVAVASVAGLLRDYPGASLYSASKRGVIALCDAYRACLAPYSVAVTVLVPGYIDTARLRELNHGDASGKPFLQTERQAVAEMTRAIAERRARRVFPWQMHWLVVAFNCLPWSLRRMRKT